MPDIPEFVAPDDENLDDIPDPNVGGNMVGEILPDDWTPDGDR